MFFNLTIMKTIGKIKRYCRYHSLAKSCLKEIKSRVAYAIDRDNNRIVFDKEYSDYVFDVIECYCASYILKNKDYFTNKGFYIEDREDNITLSWED